MADTKTSALPAASLAATANELPINEAGTSKKLTVGQIRDLIGGLKTVVVNDHSVSSTTQTKVTELDGTLAAGTYRFSYYLIVQSATTTVGLTFAINYTGTATRITYMLSWPDVGASSATGQMDDAAAVTTGQLVAHSVSRSEGTTTATVNTGTAGVITVDVDHFIKIEGVIVVSDGGNLELWHGSETNTATRVEAGSNLMVMLFV